MQKKVPSLPTDMFFFLLQVNIKGASFLVPKKRLSTTMIFAAKAKLINEVGDERRKFVPCADMCITIGYTLEHVSSTREKNLSPHLCASNGACTWDTCL